MPFNPVMVIGFGVGVGILVGMTGIGGGALMTPLLVLFVGTPPVTAVGTDLAYGAITKTVGAYKHWRQKTIDFGLSWWMAIGSVPAAIGGVYVVKILEKSLGKDFDKYMLYLLAGAIAFTGAVTLIRAIFLKQLLARERDTIRMQARHKIAAILLGLSVGFVLGITSAGSGSLIALGLIMIFRLSPYRVVGTDIFHAAILLWAAAIAHVVAGNVDYRLAGTILIGSVPGVWLGSHLSVRLPAGTLRTVLGVVLIGAAMGLGVKAGLPIPTWAIAVVPCLMAVIILVDRFRNPVPRMAADTNRPGMSGH
ncbi:MAG TPA: sulfite exporter TauE/SafE family protein [Gemmatimonadales bacterium]|nr:sulfite exporter TauE/SafE family protein [Gemmatimonadales bacterium]